MELTQEQREMVENSQWVVNTVMKQLNIVDEDIKQDAYISLCQLAIKFDKERETKFTTYAYKTLYLTTKRKYARTKINESKIVEEDESMPNPTNTETATINKIILDDLQGALKGRELKVFVFMRQGYNPAEIGKIMGLSKAQVMNIKRNMIERLRKL